MRHLLQRATAGVRDHWLVHPYLAAYLALAAVLLTSPALWIGWQFDDHFHRLVMLGHEAVSAHPLEVFATTRSDPAVLRQFVDDGLFPWWTPEGFRLAFFRPLSALSMWVDYRLWPDTPLLMHLHSLVWLAAVVVVATQVYRRVIGPHWGAGLAALLYAVDDVHAGPAAWLANRNALLAAAFGFLALWSFDRARRHGSKAGAVLSPVCLALALSSGEMAVATGAYLLAYALFLDTATWRRRLAALSPHLLVLLAWAVVYATFDFGTRGSGFYRDPLAQPAAFASALATRVPVLLLGQWTPVPADWAMLFPEESLPALWLGGLVVLGLLVVFLGPLIRASRTARFWALGMVLSLVPIAGVAPANRLLPFVSLGAMGLAAEFVCGIVDRRSWVPARNAWRVPARVLVVLLLVSHVGLAALTRPLLAYSMKPLGDPMIAAVATVPADAAIAGQDLVLVNPPDYLFLVSPIGAIRLVAGAPVPRRLRALVSGTSPVDVTRVGASSLRVRVPESLYGGVLGRLFRSQDDPMHPGQRFDVPGMHVEVVATDEEGNPVELVHTFDVPLEDGSLRWLQWNGTGYVPFDPPGIGESVSLPAGFGPMDVMRARAR